ncbi:phosphopantetheine-binding protein [Pseudorhodoferax sp. Leaf274]|uniref:phosphopantetheine-binding protein n=1 Tax=Pseudorhodoferax sp. Leaf274 TaxID=1736318 RepID=UPI0007038FFD|nr:phosphopantetheine-binding protein [Pseudorhodoferax sp. Leaf274]KQP41157.1 hypothetical protein ASF44_30345 [Pseudorhodoferax sp. Leaf274]
MEAKTTLEMLEAEVAKVLNQETINVDLAIGELGVDSMRVVELILICDQLYQAPLDPEALDINQFTTLRDMDRQFQDMAARHRAGQVNA